MSNKQRTVIPLDVYGLIIDSLAEDDEELTTMRACSLVSRAFLPLSRKHIFASVDINNPGSTSPRINTFVHLIERNPEIGEYVRKFDYCIATHDHTFPIPRTLSKLTRLKSLTLCYHRENTLVWRTDCPIHSALLHLMQLPTLSHLKLRWIKNFPVSDLIHSSSLKHLDIEYTEFAQEDVVPPTTPLPRTSVFLRKYSVGVRSRSIQKLVEAKRPDGLPVVDFTELTKVTANFDDQEDINGIQPIFVQAEQLKEIDLTISELLTYAGLAEMVIQSIRTLKVLKLSALIDDPSEDPLSGLYDELEKISATGRSIIETLSINVTVSTDADCKRGDEWGLLDKVLTKQDGWLGLKDVSLKIEVYDAGRDDDDDLVDALNKLPDTQFKKLSTSEIINFIFEVTEELV